MSTASAVILEHRGLLRIGGPDARTFLQGVVSNDVTKAGEDRAIWSAFLTPQGKFLHDFFLIERGGALLLTPEAARLEDLAKRLKLYKLRSQVEIEDASGDFRLVALFGLPCEEAGGKLGAPVFADPRLEEAGCYAILEADGLRERLEQAGFELGGIEDYDRRRIPLGLPDGSRDMEVEKAILLENGFDELRGVDWDKGCYMGQELTARTKYRGLIKKRLLPVVFEGAAPEAGTQVVTPEGKDAGEVRSSATASDGAALGLALLRLDKLGGPLQAGDAVLTPQVPAWMKLPAAEKSGA